MARLTKAEREQKAAMEELDALRSVFVLLGVALGIGADKSSAVRAKLEEMDITAAEVGP